MRELRGDWRDIFKGFSVALDLKKLLMGFLALALSVVVGIAGPFFLASLLKPSLWQDLVNRNYNWLCELICKTWNTLGELPLGWLILTVAVIYLLLVIIWSYFGGVICRIAAINLTKDEGLELAQGLSFATKKYLSFLTPWIIPILGFIFFGFWNFLGGLVGRIPYVGELGVAIFLPLAILSGFIMVFIAIGFIFGKRLFYPTIAVEGSDSFDAMSRSFSYLYARPWHYIFYYLVALVYGALTTAFVWVFGYFMIVAAFWAGALGMGGKFTYILNKLGISGHFGLISSITGLNLNCTWLPPAQASDRITMTIATFILAIWLVLVVGFVLSYVVSYWLSIDTVIYLLLRKKVDDIDMKEVYEEKEEEELPAPTTPTEGTKPEEKPPAPTS